MSNENSVSQWMHELKAGDEEAARLLWHRYFDKLVQLARKRLGTAPRRESDEEDVALSVFRCLCSGAQRGQFDELSDRSDLWHLMVAMTAHKVVDQRRIATGLKRGGGAVRGDSAMGCGRDSGAYRGFDQVISKDPSPEFVIMLADEHQHLMELLDDDTLRQTAVGKMEGHTNEQIAEQLGITRRSVERKLERIRHIWFKEFDR